jgi:LmbE family N-acetylglucosaminyl deacetylase
MDYRSYVLAFENQYRAASGFTSNALPSLGAPPVLRSGHDRPHVLIVAPHPDDECLMGSYALRMKEEWGAVVWVYPYSLGSRADRQGPRWLELQASVQVLGFELIDARKKTLAQALDVVAPEIIFAPHGDDGHATHIACSKATELAMIQWLEQYPGQEIIWNQTEFWHAMRSPNLLIPLSAEHVIRMGEALEKHVGEVARNPYHLRLPGWLMDQVRRVETVAGAGSSAHPEWVFGQLYTQVKLTR